MAVDSGSTAFIIVCAALVNFMTPGLAFFYGGLVRQQNVLTIIMQNFVAMGLVTMIWVVWGFSLCFGKSGKMFGSPATYAMLSNIEDLDGDIPGLAFARASAPPNESAARAKPHRAAKIIAASLLVRLFRGAHGARVRRGASPPPFPRNPRRILPRMRELVHASSRVPDGDVCFRGSLRESLFRALRPGVVVSAPTDRPPRFPAPFPPRAHEQSSRACSPSSRPR